MAREAFRQTAKGNQTLRGFALRDLLAVISLVALAGTLFSTSLAGVRKGRDGILCLNNGRQMMRAFALYAEDYNGLLPPNEDVLMPGHNWIGANANASSRPEATNQFLLGDRRINLLAPYAPDSTIWKCPADPATVLVGRVRVRTIRSVSMNGAVGTACASFPVSHSVPLVPTHGSWLDGTHGHLRGTEFRTFGRPGDFVAPAETLIFIDEHPPSINDGVFGQPGYDPQKPTFGTVRWVDYPADYHRGAAGITFADGHVEMHRWRGLRYPPSGLPGSFVPPSQRADWEWLGMHVTQLLR